MTEAPLGRMARHHHQLPRAGHRDTTSKHNNFRGNIPSEIGNLSHTEGAVHHFRRLSNLKADIPTEIENLSQLEIH